MKVWDRAEIELATSGSRVRHVTDFAVQSGETAFRLKCDGVESMILRLYAVYNYQKMLSQIQQSAFRPRCEKT